MAVRRDGAALRAPVAVGQCALCGGDRSGVCEGFQVAMGQSIVPHAIGIKDSERDLAMGHYLRDQQATNISVTESAVSQISAVFIDRAKALNDEVPEDDDSGRRAFISYIIRFDNKGVRVFTLEELLRHFRQAKSVERLIFSVETGQSVQSNRQVGAYLELKLDEKDANGCFFTATADDSDWVDASFSSMQETLAKYKNRNGWVRSSWTAFGVQIVGVTPGFVLSLWAATKLAPRLSIENAFIFSFFFILLIFSNTWTYLNQLILRIVNLAFPNVKFLRSDKERLHWLLQAVIGGIAGAAALFFLNQVFMLFLEMIGSLA